MSSGFLIVVSGVGCALLARHEAMSQNLRQGPGNENRTTLRSEFKMDVRDGYRYISSNGIPNHATGQFPNANNPNSIRAQSYSYRVTLHPVPAAAATRLPKVFGVAVNGVPYDPSTAEAWNGNFQWRYEALSGFFSSQGGLGVDTSLAHVQPNGAYHYHGLPFALLEKLDYRHKPALIGFAADGFPIYGNYGYSNSENANSPIRVLKSSYRLKSGSRPGGQNSPGGAYDGSFAQDYEYVKGAGDLDEFNGRTGVTPEYPAGTYYYVITDTFPFVSRQFRGTPDATFLREGGPGRGGPGGPGGPGGQFGGPGGQQFGRPGSQFGPPPGFIPSDGLPQYLNLTAAQSADLTKLEKAVNALRNSRFALRAFADLKLTKGQISRLATGEKLSTVLTADQQSIVQQNQMPAFGPPGGPQGFGPPPGGQPGFGPPPGGP